MKSQVSVDYYDYYDVLGPSKGGFKDEDSSFVQIILIIMMSLALARVDSRMKSQVSVDYFDYYDIMIYSHEYCVFAYEIYFV